MPQQMTMTPYTPNGAADAGPKAATAIPAAMAKSRMDVVSSSAVATGAGAPTPASMPSRADPARKRARAATTGRYDVDKLTWDATSHTSKVTSPTENRCAAFSWLSVSGTRRADHHAGDHRYTNHQGQMAEEGQDVDRPSGPEETQTDTGGGDCHQGRTDQDTGRHGAVPAGERGGGDRGDLSRGQADGDHAPPEGERRHQAGRRPAEGGQDDGGRGDRHDQPDRPRASPR